MKEYWIVNDWNYDSFIRNFNIKDEALIKEISNDVFWFFCEEAFMIRENNKWSFTSNWEAEKKALIGAICHGRYSLKTLRKEKLKRLDEK